MKLTLKILKMTAIPKTIHWTSLWKKDIHFLNPVRSKIKELKSIFINYEYIDTDFLEAIKSHFEWSNMQIICQEIFLLIMQEQPKMMVNEIQDRIEAVFWKWVISPSMLVERRQHINKKNIKKTIQKMFSLYQNILNQKWEIAHPNDENFMEQIDKLTYKPELQPLVDQVLTEIKTRCDTLLFPQEFFMSNQNGEINYYL